MAKSTKNIIVAFLVVLVVLIAYNVINHRETQKTTNEITGNSIIIEMKASGIYHSGKRIENLAEFLEQQSKPTDTLVIMVSSSISSDDLGSVVNTAKSKGIKNIAVAQSGE